MEVFFLGDRPDLVPAVAKTTFEQWPAEMADYGHTSPETVADWILANQMHKDKIPLMLVGVINGEAVATAGLDKDDMNSGPYKDVGPWMVSIFVHPKYRGMSLAQRMIKEIMGLGKRMGIRTVYLWTEHAASLYTRFGWTKVDEIDYVRKRVTIMTVDLGSEGVDGGGASSLRSVSVAAAVASHHPPSAPAPPTATATATATAIAAAAAAATAPALHPLPA